MNSRMEKYYKDDNLPKRSTKNQDLYESIYNDSDYTEVNIAPKARTINIEELKQMINNNKREVQRKKLENFTDYSGFSTVSLGTDIWFNCSTRDFLNVCSSSSMYPMWKIFSICSWLNTHTSL